MVSALFTINGSAIGTGFITTTGSATVNVALVSSVGVTKVEWSVAGYYPSTITIPTITKSGVPLGTTASFTMPGEPLGYTGYGVVLIIKCKVNSGKNTNGSANPDYIKYGCIGVENLATEVPFSLGETGENGTHAIVNRLNSMLRYASDEPVAPTGNPGEMIIVSATGTLEASDITWLADVFTVPGSISVDNINGYTFPDGYGTNGYVLTTDGSGGLSWVEATVDLDGYARTSDLEGYATTSDLDRYVTGPNGVTANDIPLFDGVSGKVIKDSNLQVDTGNLVVKAYGTSPVDFRLMNGADSKYTGFRCPDALSSTVVYKLPLADGSANQVLSTDGAGTLAWQTATVDLDGYVVGPASAIDNAIARYNLETGKLIQNSVATLSDAGILNLSSTGRLELGSNPSTAGHIRLPADTSIYYRNYENTGNIRMVLSSISNNNIIFGDDGYVTNLAGTAVDIPTVLKMGTNAATTGRIRLPTSFTLYYRNAANSDNLLFASGSVTDDITIGNSGNITTVVGSTVVVSPGILEIGTNAATTGNIRLPADFSIYYRNVEDTADVRFLMSSSSSNHFSMGNDGYITYILGERISLQPGGTEYYVFDEDAFIVNKRQNIRLYNSTNTYYTTFKAGEVSSNISFTLPTTQGSTNQILNTNGSGQCGWTTLPNFDGYLTTASLLGWGSSLGISNTSDGYTVNLSGGSTLSSINQNLTIDPQDGYTVDIGNSGDVLLSTANGYVEITNPGSLNVSFNRAISMTADDGYNTTIAAGANAGGTGGNTYIYGGGSGTTTNGGSIILSVGEGTTEGYIKATNATVIKDLIPNVLAIPRNTEVEEKSYMWVAEEQDGSDINMDILINTDEEGSIGGADGYRSYVVEYKIMVSRSPFITTQFLYKKYVAGWVKTDEDVLSSIGSLTEIEYVGGIGDTTWTVAVSNPDDITLRLTITPSVADLRFVVRANLITTGGYGY